MNKSVTPVVLSDDGNRHEPMRNGEVFDVSTLPISTSRQNLLETDSTGILLTGNMLVSPLEHNPIVENVDGKLYMRVQRMLSPEDKVFKVSDNLMRAQLSLRFDPDTSKLALLGKDDTVISEFVLPVSAGLPTVVEILQNTVPPKPDGFTENPYKKGTYLHMRFRTGEDKQTDIYLDMSKLVDIYTGGRGIEVVDHVISVSIKEGGGLKFDACCDDPDCPCKAPLVVDSDAVAPAVVKPDDKVLGVEDGKIGTEIRLAFDDSKKIITLLGRNDVSLGEVRLPDAPELPDIPALPTLAEFVVNPAGSEPGTYLHLQFTLQDGLHKDFYLNVSPLLIEYQAGDGIVIKDRAVAVDFNTTLWVANGKLGVRVPQLVVGNDNILRVVNNKISAVVGMKFNPATNTLALTGADDAVITEIALPESVGIPTSANFIANYQPEGAAKPGMYLRLHFSTAQGGRDFYLNVDPLIDVYEAGDGIEIKDHVVSVKFGADNDNALMLSKSGNLYVNKEKLVSKIADNALSIGADNRLYVDTKPKAEHYGGGLKVGGNGKVRVVLEDLISPDSGLIVKDGKLTVSPDALANVLGDKISVPVSADADNILRVGSDGKPYLPGDLGKLGE